MIKFFFFTLMLFSTVAHAQPIPNKDADNSKLPVEISADHSIEWHRDVQEYIARGNAEAKQGDSIINAQILKAHYKKNDKGKTAIWKISGNNAVAITSGTNKAYGDTFNYDIDNGKAIMTGGNLRLLMENNTITAQERFIYDSKNKNFTAQGRGKIVSAKDTLEADIITAYFVTRNGKDEISRVDANGNVVITTPDEIITGTNAAYNADLNTAEVTNNVTIKRGLNILKGNRATVDLDTNISRLFANENEAAKGSGRVRGTFYPDSSE